MRAVRVRIFALFAALLMLLPSGASARTLYHCQMMGRTVASCCCETAAPFRGTGVQELQSADCCQRLSASARSAALGTLAVDASVPPAAWLATTAAPFGVVSEPAQASFCAEATQAPLAIGPPLFVAHCAFLS